MLLVIPNIFVPFTIADANQVNENFAAVVGSVNNIDHTNIGPLGIYASQIIPVDRPSATFGSDQTYYFNNGSATTVALTLVQANGQSTDMFEVIDSKATVHTLMAIGATGGLAVTPIDPTTVLVKLIEANGQTAPAIEILANTQPVVLVGPDAQIQLTPNSGNTIPLIINQAGAGQTAPMMQFWNAAHTQVVQAVFHHGGLHITPDLRDTILLTLVAGPSQAVDILDIFDNASNKLIWVDSTGVLHLNTSAVFTGGGITVGPIANNTGIWSVMDETFQVLALINGGHHDNTGWVADRHQAQLYVLTQDPTQSFVWYADTGLTLGATYDPTPVMTLTNTGILRLPIAGGGLGLGFATLACNVQGISLPHPHMDMVVGAHWLDPNWVADDITSESFELLRPNVPTDPAFAWYADVALSVGHPFGRTQVATLSEYGTLTLSNAVQPGSGKLSPVIDTTGAKLFSGTGDPFGSQPVNARIGDFYFRFDFTVATTDRIYVCSAINAGVQTWVKLI